MAPMMRSSHIVALPRRESATAVAGSRFPGATTNALQDVASIGRAFAGRILTVRAENCRCQIGRNRGCSDRPADLGAPSADRSSTVWLQER
jgi:hypothetical protein